MVSRCVWPVWKKDWYDVLRAWRAVSVGLATLIFQGVGVSVTLAQRGQHEMAPSFLYHLNGEISYENLFAELRESQDAQV